MFLSFVSISIAYPIFQNRGNQDDDFRLNSTWLLWAGFNSSTDTMYLPFANIDSIDPDTFQIFPNLQVKKKKIYAFFNCLKFNQNFKVLILSFSRIKALEPKTFSNLNINIWNNLL